jgi:biotin carboxylase
LNKKIAILGASYLQKPLVDKAREMGVETHCFAWDNEDAICKTCADFFYPISVLDKEEILKQCKQIGIDGITTIATDICVPTISYVAEHMNLISNTYQSAIISTNKALMRRAFNKCNVSSPTSIVIDNSKTISVEDLIMPLIVKPTDRSGSRGVSKVNNLDELKDAISIALNESFEKKAVVEEFIEGVEISVETISWNGEHYILAITDKVTTGSPYFVEIEHHQPSYLSETLQAIVKESTVKVLNALDIKFGASHSEFKIKSNNTVTAIEVGARMGGDFIGSHLVKLSTGYDFLKGVIQIALNVFEKPLLNEKKFSGVYFLSKETDYLLPFFQENSDEIIEKSILKNELVNIKNSNDRSGYFIYQSTTKLIPH